MQDDHDNSVDAARQRIERHRNDPIGLRERSGDLRTKIIEVFEPILWVVLGLGVLSAFFQLVTFQVVTALMTLVTTIATVGVGFIALDIRDRLMGR